MALMRNDLRRKPRDQRIERKICIPSLFMRQLADKGLEYLGTRIGDGVHRMAHAVNQSLLVKRLAPQQTRQIISYRILVCRVCNAALQILEHLHNLIIRAAVLWPLKRTKRRRDCGIGIGAG